MVLSGKIFNVLPGNAHPQFGVFFTDLEPGTYILKSLKIVWQDTLRLQGKSEIKLEDITVPVLRGGSVEKTFMEQKHKQWQAEYSAKDWIYNWLLTSNEAVVVALDFPGVLNLTMTLARHTLF